MTPALLKKYLKMKRLLLPLLAALPLPTAVNAESHYILRLRSCLNLLGCNYKKVSFS